MDITIETSLGELVDKLTILDIKKIYISDSDNLFNVRKEFNSLNEVYMKYKNETYDYLFGVLKYINHVIWKDQDLFRSSINSEEKNALCKRIIDYNDRRFKVKNKLNRMSTIKEVKSYNKSNVYVSFDEDIIPKTRYMTTLYDHVTLVAPNVYTRVFIDDPSISVIDKYDGECLKNVTLTDDEKKIFTFVSKISIFTPNIFKYKKEAIKAIESGWISNHGENIHNCERFICSFFNVKYCILTCNGTLAVDCMIKATMMKYPNRNIYIPDNTFISPVNCVLMNYNHDKIHIMKIDELTYNINTSEEYISSLIQNSVVLIVHNLGNIVNIPRLKRMRPDLIFIEDNCEGLLGKYEDKWSGTDSFCSAVSFYGNKTITTGEGGCFITNDEQTYEYIKSFTSHGMSNKRYVHNVLSLNYRMTNIQAAFLIEQLDDIYNIINQRKKIYKYYTQIISNYKILDVYENESNVERAPWIFSVKINKKFDYDKVEHKMEEFGIEIRPVFYDMSVHKHIMLKNKHDIVTMNGIMLPSSINITFDECVFIIKCLIQSISD